MLFSVSNLNACIAHLKLRKHTCCKHRLCCLYYAVFKWWCRQKIAGQMSVYASLYAPQAWTCRLKAVVFAARAISAKSHRDLRDSSFSQKPNSSVITEAGWFMHHKYSHCSFLHTSHFGCCKYLKYKPQKCLCHHSSSTTRRWYKGLDD